MRKTFLTIAVLVTTSLSLFAQNVGVGTQSPSEKLDVNGNVKISGALKPGGYAGVAGQVLTSKGEDVPPQWLDAPQSPINLSGQDKTMPSGALHSFSSDWYGVRVERNATVTLPYDGKWMVFIKSVATGCNYDSAVFPHMYDLYYDTNADRWKIWQNGTGASGCSTEHLWFGFGAIKVSQ